MSLDVRMINPFVEAAYFVLEQEVGISAQRGSLSVDRSSYTNSEISVLVSFKGEMNGIVLYGLSETAAIAMVSKILDEPFDEFDELVQSGVAEMGNVVTGQAGTRLEAAGLSIEISTPTVIVGKGTLITSLDINRICVPLKTPLGDMQILLGIRELQ